MPALPRFSHVVMLTLAVSVFAVVLGWIGWPDPRRGVEFALLMLAAIVTSLPALQALNRDWPALRSSFVIEFSSLVTFGPLPTLIVAGCGVVARAVADQQRAIERPTQFGLQAARILVSLVAAAWAHAAFGGTLGRFDWPWQALPVAAAALTYCIVTSIIADIVIPRLERRGTLDVWHWWPQRFLETCPAYIVGASVAVGLAEMLARHKWDVLVVTAAPLYLAYRVYSDHVNRLEQEHRRGEAIESLTDGVCVVDRSGQVTLWNDALERLLGCPRNRTIGRSLRFAVAGLAETELPNLLDDVARTRAPRTLAHIRLRCIDGVRLLQVKLIPGTDGVTLLWQDVTEHTRAVQALQRHRERLALAAEVANDGLWEWDVSTQQFFVTGRWKAMVGLPPSTVISKVDEWLDRVHQDDIGPLRDALEAHFAGKTDRFEHEHRIRHEDGRYKVFQCRGIATRRGGARPSRIAGSLTDTTDLAVTQERLRNAVFLDPLTGLCNRAVFVEELGKRIQEYHRRHCSEPFALLYLDLDRFKVVNDSLGHLVGDELLIAVSRRLESCLREGDVLARLGGDEFAILLNILQTEQQANVVAFRVQETLSKPFSIGGREVFTSASIGIAFGLRQYTTPDEMMHDADTAMYQAKAHGKARHEVFDADMDARARDRLGLENDLRHAISWNDFEVHYQPIVSLASGMCVGFESLVRWTRNGKPVSPATFIPIAEELGLIEPLGTRVLEEACSTFAGWQRKFPDAGLECITVNVSSRQLMQQNFLMVVERAVRKAQLEPSALRIEITETALMTSPDVAAKVLTELRDFGVKIYLDDFGTGYSSLSHLHKLPVDALKIDRSFVRSLLLPDRPAIVESILALARTLETSVVAEGIETDVQAGELERLGCTHAQGYLFSPPISTAAAHQMLAANKPLGPKGADEEVSAFA
jgi:diguanylate cyclase (GGDEF)-like protein/PAS domain S-box-containing protein